jgi:hypothetical protein
VGKIIIETDALPKRTMMNLSTNRRLGLVYRFIREIPSLDKSNEALRVAPHRVAASEGMERPGLAGFGMTERCKRMPDDGSDTDADQ